MFLILSRLVCPNTAGSLKKAQPFINSPSSKRDPIHPPVPRRLKLRPLIVIANGIVGFFLLNSVLSTVAFGQGCGFVRERELSRGPISFSGLKQSQFTILSSGDVDGIKHCIIRYTASGGDFSYDNDKGNVLKGSIVSFRLKADLTPIQGANGATLKIQPGDLDVTLNTSSQISVQAYGGFVHLAAKQRVQISNPTEIFIQSPAVSNPITTKAAKINQTGELQIRTSNQLNWVGALFRFPQLPSQLTLDLVAPKSNTLDKEFELPLNSGVIRVTKALFSYTLPSGVGGKTWPIKGTAYRAIVNQFQIGEFRADLQRDNLGVRIQDLAGIGEFTGRVLGPPSSDAPVAVIFSGNASVAQVTGRAPFSRVVADVQNIKITGLKLKSTSKQEDRIAVDFKRRATAESDSMRTFFSMGQNFESSITASNARDTPLLQELKPEDFYTPSAGQVSAMREMGIKPLSDQQRAAIAESRAELGKIVGPNFLINYPAKDFKQLLPQIAASHGLQVLDTKLGRQELLVLAAFSNSPNAPDTLGQSDAIKFVFRIVPSIAKRLNPETNKQEHVLILRYTMGLARIDQISLSDTLSPDEISDAVSDQVDRADTASQDPTPLTITLPLEIAKSFDLNKSFTDPATKATVTIRSKNVQALFTVVSSILLIDEQGIHLMGILEAK